MKLKKNWEPKSGMKQCAERFQTVIMRRQKKSALTGLEGWNCSEILWPKSNSLTKVVEYPWLEGLIIHSYDGLGKKEIE